MLATRLSEPRKTALRWLHYSVTVQNADGAFPVALHILFLSMFIPFLIPHNIHP